jgi:hypothetical protein
MNKWLVFVLTVLLVLGCRHKPTKVTNPTPGGIIVVDEEGNESEFLPMTEAEFKKLQDDLRKQKP